MDTTITNSYVLVIYNDVNTNGVSLAYNYYLEAQNKNIISRNMREWSSHMNMQ